ncbi:hypothetical protein CL653_00390 [bacterium]|nr:hypothetical protein [bacterium]
MKKFSLTTKGSYRPNSTKKRFKVVMAAGVLLVLFSLVAPTVGRGITSVILWPMVKVGYWWNESTALIPHYFKTHTAAARRIEELENQMLEDKVGHLTIERLRFENGSLRGMVGEGSGDRVLASVLLRPNQVPYDSLVLDKGRSSGVEENAPVYLADDVVVGFVSRVFKNSSVVTLVSTPKLESTVYVVGPNIYTTAVGVGGGILQIGVPQDIALNVGDMVILPTIHSGVFGQITHIEKDPSAPEQFGYVSLPVNLNSLYLVTIGRSSIEPVDFATVEDIVSRVKTDITTTAVPEGMLIEIPSATSTAASSESQL